MECVRHGSLPETSQGMGWTQRGLATAGPLLQNWIMAAAHGGGWPASRCSRTDAKQPPQAHCGVG
jgi:hypothetical protein